MYQAQREMENYERRKVYHRAYYSLDAYSWLENYALEHSRSPEDILLEREEMTTRLHLIAALPVALAHATPTQARRVHAYYIAGIKQPEISRIEGIHSSKVSVAIRRGLRNMRRCYDGLFQTIRRKSSKIGFFIHNLTAASWKTYRASNMGGCTAVNPAAS